MDYNFSYGIREIGFELKFADRMTLKIEVLPDTRVIVTAPKGMDAEKVLSEVKRSGGVIYKRLSNAEKAQKQNKDVLEEKAVLFRGEKYPLMKMDEGKKRPRLEFDGKVFTVYNAFGDKLRKSISSFYQEAGKAEIPPRVDYFASEMGVKTQSIWVKTQHKRWGSSKSDGSVYLNYVAIALPQDVVDYIIVHELAHMKYDTHSADFWRLVNEYAPDYKEKEAYLVTTGSLISYLYT